MAGLSRICSLEHVIDRHSTGRGIIRTWSHRLERLVRRHGQRSDADLQKDTPKLDWPANTRRAGGIISDAFQTAKKRTSVLFNQRSPLS